MFIKKPVIATTTLISLLCVFFFHAATAKYTVTVTKGTYSDLSGATDLPFNTTDSGYYYQANFIFPVFNRLANFNQDIAHQSNGGFLSDEGYLAVYEAPGYINTIVFQCLYDHDGFKSWPGTTKVSAKMEGTSPNRILKFQWKDIVNQGDPAQRISFQVWLHESDSSITYHYGPNTLAAQANQSYSGIIVLASNFSDVLDECNLEGSPTIPVIYDTFKTVSLPTLDSIPSNGTIYTFKRANTSGIKDMEGATSGFTVFPNPANDMLTVETPAPASVYLCDITGKIVAAISAGKGTTTVSTEKILAGMYFVHIRTGEETQVRKVWITH
jgi:hypothetical protein